MYKLGKYTEGHYTIKRVDKLPKNGNANMLYAIRSNVIDKFYRWVGNGKYETILIGGGILAEPTDLVFDSVSNKLTATFADGSIKTTTIDILSGPTDLVFDSVSSELTATFVDGSVKTTVIDISTGGQGSTSSISNTVTGNRIATHSDGDSISTDINETVTELERQEFNNTLTYSSENNFSTSITINPIIEITAQDFFYLRLANGLVPGQEYEIIDYTPRYTQLETNVDSASPQGVTDGLNVAARYNPILKAKTKVLLEKKARTTMDNIIIEVVPNALSDRLFVTRTIDTDTNVDVDYDLLHEKFRLYKINIPTYNSASNYNIGDIVKTGSIGSEVYYVRLKDSFNSSTLDGTESINNQRLWRESTYFSQIANQNIVNQDFAYKNLSSDLSTYTNYYGIEAYNPASGNNALARIRNIKTNRGVVITSTIAYNTSISTKSNSNFSQENQTIAINGAVTNTYITVDKNSLIGGMQYVTANITNSIFSGIEGKNSDSFFDIKSPVDFYTSYITDSYIHDVKLNHIGVLRSVLEKINLHQLNDGEYFPGTGGKPSILYSVIIKPTGSIGTMEIYFGNTINRTKIIGYNSLNLKFKEGIINSYFYLEDNRLDIGEYAQIDVLHFDSQISNTHFYLDPSTTSNVGNNTLNTNSYYFRTQPVHTKDIIFKPLNPSVPYYTVDRYHSPTGISTTVRSTLTLFTEETDIIGNTTNTII